MSQMACRLVPGGVVQSPNLYCIVRYIVLYINSHHPHAAAHDLTTLWHKGSQDVQRKHSLIKSNKVYYYTVTNYCIRTYTNMTNKDYYTVHHALKSSASWTLTCSWLVN
jgi:hypothetical protein